LQQPKTRILANSAAAGGGRPLSPMMNTFAHLHNFVSDLKKGRLFPALYSRKNR
jgi:hypothetical protein